LKPGIQKNLASAEQAGSSETASFFRSYLRRIDDEIDRLTTRINYEEYRLTQP
jgi:hypothetical protein